MATQNRRIAAYLPPEIDQKLKAFKIEAGLATKRNPTKNDSQDLIAILTQFFGLDHEAPYASATELRQKLADLEAKLDRLSTTLSEKIAHLETDLADLKQAKIDIEETEPAKPKAESVSAFSTVPGQLNLLDGAPAQSGGNIEPIEAGETLLQASVIPSKLLKGLSAAQLAHRFPVSRTTIDGHRKKGKEHFQQWSADQDPDGIPWQYRRRLYFPVTQE